MQTPVDPFEQAQRHQCACIGLGVGLANRGAQRAARTESLTAWVA